MARIGQKTASSPSLLRISQEAFDRLPLGVIKVDQKGDVLYMNKKLCEVTGIGRWRGRNIRIVLDDKNYKKVLGHIEKRLTERSAGEYHAEITREDNKNKIPVMITAIPETDEEGNPTGSIAFVRSLLLDTCTRAIHRHIETYRDSETLLQRVAEEVDKVAPWDVFSVYLYSRDRSHFKTLFSRSKIRNLPRPEVRWVEINHLFARWLRQKKPLTINDFPSWLNKPEQEELRLFPGVQRFVALGFRSTWWRPIVSGKEVVAAVSMYSRKKHAFGSPRDEMLKSLPLVEAANMAIHHVEASNLQFRLDLEKDLLSGSCDPKNIASVIIDRVAAHYKWENVSLFGVDEEMGVFRLLGQRGVSEEKLLDEEYVQSVNDGILGRVYHEPDNGRFKNIGDVTSEEFKDIFIQGYGKPTNSALCLPILVDNKVGFLFNVEDSKQNAFAPEEQEAIETLLDDVAMLLNRFCLQHRLEAIGQATKDMVILTDRRGIIKEMNPAASRLLGYSEGEVKGTWLGTYMKDRGLATYVAAASGFGTREIVFLKKDGAESGELRVLLSCASLPKEVGMKVFIGSDLSYYRRDEEMGILRSMYNEIALQTKTPLSLVFSWLERLGEDKNDVVQGIAKKALRQLHKIDLTFDRLMLFERNKTTIPYSEVLLDLWHLVNRIKEEMPESEAERIVVKRTEKLPAVKGDIFQLSFCIESIMSYLFRFAAADDTLWIDLKGNDGTVAALIRGKGPLAIGEDMQAGGGPGWIAHTLTEMALGKDMIKALVERNRGTFRETQEEGGQLTFELVFKPDATASEGG